MTPIELLAPARNLECGRAAILSGADAVYMGGPRFGARQNAGNSLEDLSCLANFAHFYGARVYAALNTLILEPELQEVQDLVWKLYEAGVDALIVQDMGILEMKLPPLPLFASTQTHNAGVEQVKFLQDTGFQRVILARELSLSEIKAIKEQTHVELEAFVHGALCVSYSGRCYLSQALGGRSGNRGECAQPCREAYTLEDAQGRILEKDRHVLSLKDMNRLNHLEALLDVGITSFKIEGRLKDVSYVTNVCAAYRQTLDALIEKKGLLRASQGKSLIDFEPDLNKTFNRDYTPYFLQGREKNMACFETPKSKGEVLGPVVSLDAESITLKTSKELNPGDGLCFFNPSGVLQGTSVHRVEENRIFVNSVEGIGQGTLIYRNYDHEFEKKLAARLPERKVGVNAHFFETEQGFAFTLKDEEGLEVTLNENHPKEPAQNALKARETLKKQLSKMGDSDFYLISFSFQLSRDYFFPVSVLNQLRRNAVKALKQIREKRILSRPGAMIQTIPYFKTELDFEGNITNSLARRFYEKRGVKKIQPGAEAGGSLAGKRLMTLKYCVAYERGECLKNAPEAPKNLTLKNSRGVELILKIHCKDCQNEVFLKNDGKDH